jgi:hypothetical protein
LLPFTRSTLLTTPPLQPLLVTEIVPLAGPVARTTMEGPGVTTGAGPAILLPLNPAGIVQVNVLLFATGDTPNVTLVPIVKHAGAFVIWATAGSSCRFSV